MYAILVSSYFMLIIATLFGTGQGPDHSSHLRHGEEVGRESGAYSYRNARIGSIRAARRAGT